MESFVSKHATAAHLALLAVAPLFLYLFVPAPTADVLMLWLSLFAGVWVFAVPGKQGHDSTLGATSRFVRAVIRDPLTWVVFAALVLTVVRWINDGVAMTYSLTRQTWSLADPRFEMLPSSATGACRGTFSTLVAALVLFVGLMHSMNDAFRKSFILIAVLLSALWAFVCMLGVEVGMKPFVTLSPALTGRIGVAFGFWTFFSLVCLFYVFEMNMPRLYPLGCLAVSGNLIGMLSFAPVTHAQVLGVALSAVVVIAFSFGQPSRFLGRLLLLLVSVAVPAVFIVFSPDDSLLASRASTVLTASFPEGYAKADAAYSLVAFRAWRVAPWFGSGAGAFDMVIRFLAEPGEWSALLAVPSCVGDGWLRLLIERGVVGVIVVLTVLCVPCVRIFRALWGSFPAEASIRLPGLVAVLAFLVIFFFGLSKFDAAVWMALVTTLALASTFGIQRGHRS